MDEALEKIYGNRIRTRVCGICADAEGNILVVGMNGITSNLEQNELFYAPVGGGIELGETATEALKREFLEETGIEIEIDYFMCMYEYIHLPIHAIELFFAVRPAAGTPKVGTDPEQGKNQIIKQVKYLSYAEIKKLPALQRHGIFKYASSTKGLKELRGYIRINDKSGI